jgi:hypothetical protein
MRTNSPGASFSSPLHADGRNEATTVLPAPSSTSHRPDPRGSSALATNSAVRCEPSQPELIRCLPWSEISTDQGRARNPAHVLTVTISKQQPIPRQPIQIPSPNFPTRTFQIRIPHVVPHDQNQVLVCWLFRHRQNERTLNWAMNTIAANR